MLNRRSELLELRPLLKSIARRPIVAASSVRLAPPEQATRFKLIVDFRFDEEWSYP